MGMSEFPTSEANILNVQIDELIVAAGVTSDIHVPGNYIEHVGSVSEEPIAHESIEPALAPVDVEAFIVADGIRQRAAQRRRSQHTEGSRLPKHLRPMSSATESQDPHTSPQPYARGIGTRPSSEEIAKAEAVLKHHSQVVKASNKRQYHSW